jgi:hypothetical protein
MRQASETILPGFSRWQALTDEMAIQLEAMWRGDARARTRVTALSRELQRLANQHRTEPPLSHLQ